LMVPLLVSITAIGGCGAALGLPCGLPAGAPGVWAKRGAAANATAAPINVRLSRFDMVYSSRPRFTRATLPGYQSPISEFAA
jgi:hypothetical protein